LLLLLMELDDLDLSGSWPLDQITFAERKKKSNLENRAIGGKAIEN
jgi:hypothetical protein